MKNSFILLILALFTFSAAADSKVFEKREAYFKACMETTLHSIQESEKYKKHASNSFLMFAMGSCYCGRVASKFDPKDAEEMIEKLKDKEKFNKKPKMLELYESSEAACKKALLD